MPLDDDLEDNPSLVPPPSTTTTNNATGDAATMMDEVEEAEDAPTADFRLFASTYSKTKNISAQTIRKGEKDFESHGTRAQASALDASRDAMRDVLSYTRVHNTKSASGWCRGWYFPDWWKDWPEDWEQQKSKRGKEGGGRRMRRKRTGNYHRCIQSLGRAVTGLPKDRPARGREWLLPEEALYLVERGSLDLWWPTRGIEEVFPADGSVPTAAATTSAKGEGEQTEEDEEEDEDDEYKYGLPLSLQAAYALLIGEDGERGKVSLQKFQVFSHLKRAGYNVIRAPTNPLPVQDDTQLTTTTQPASKPKSVTEWLISCLPQSKSSPTDPPPYGPLVPPGFYRSYNTIYNYLSLRPSSTSSSASSTADNQPQKPQSPESDGYDSDSNSPYKIHYHIFKASTKFTRTRPPPPDFYISVISAKDTSIPTLSEISSLLASAPADLPKAEWLAGGPARLYARLKHGYRNVLLAVNDHGVINYMRFAQGGFAKEELFRNYDMRVSGGPRRGGGGGGGGGGKKSGNNNEDDRGGLIEVEFELLASRLLQSAVS
ncbi:uncharacterized protein B0T23DRAFT_444201 [Neurospora hispaniola]|uniref:tRNA-splicing endonuclease subunit Sen54 N-terminal domain-containing protein n=1 Tax=Neurospora hispaniola TaxID=588809 RepID=A0AAJ0I686_9PEZI|nr:hypothetical protein B0T23DRAFT_444201 [Neurospora hispaniola]